MDQFEVLRSDTLSTKHHEREFQNFTSGTLPGFISWKATNPPQVKVLIISFNLILIVYTIVYKIGWINATDEFVDSTVMDSL